MTATWDFLNGSAFSTRSVQTTPSETPPSQDTDGMNIDGVMALTVWLDAGVGQTITAETGQVDIYIYDAGVWGLAPAFVMAIPPGSIGQRRVQLGTVTVENRRGRIAPLVNGITVSGSTAIIDILVTLDSRGTARPA